MSSVIYRRIKQEVDLIQRFAESYGKKFDALIDHLNRPNAAVSDVECLRLCVEAVDMLLASQGQLAKALAEMNDEERADHAKEAPERAAA